MHHPQTTAFQDAKALSTLSRGEVAACIATAAGLGLLLGICVSLSAMRVMGAL